MYYNLKLDGVPPAWSTPGWAADYCSAAKFEAGIEPWRNRPNDPKPIGVRSKANVKKVEKLANDDIVFSLWDEPAVTFHPDGDISVTGWPSVSRSQFIHRLTPTPIGYVANKGALILAKDEELPSYWSAQRAREANSFALRLDKHRTVRLTRVAGRWWPKDEAALKPFSWLDIDRSEARALMREHPLGDFIAALKAYQMLLPGKLEVSPRWKYVDVPGLLDVIAERDFAAAIEAMPVTKGDRYEWNATTQTGRNIEGKPQFSITTIAKLRACLYVRAGVAKRREATIVPTAEWCSKISRNRYQPWEIGR